jgi:hypothetical protein
MVAPGRYHPVARLILVNTSAIIGRKHPDSLNS